MDVDISDEDYVTELVSIMDGYLWHYTVTI